MPFFSHNSNDLLLLFSFPVVIVVVAMLTFRFIDMEWSVKVKVEKQFSMQTLSVVLTLKAKMPSVGSMNVYLIFIPILWILKGIKISSRSLSVYIILWCFCDGDNEMHSHKKRKSHSLRDEKKITHSEDEMERNYERKSLIECDECIQNALKWCRIVDDHFLCDNETVFNGNWRALHTKVSYSVDQF